MTDKKDYSSDQMHQMESFLVGVLQKCKDANLKIVETRSLTFERVEMVVELNNIASWKEIFATDFGGVHKDQNVPPNPADMLITKAYGGINDLQVLFVKELDFCKAIAMFWPWGDSQNMTVHMAFVFSGQDASG